MQTDGHADVDGGMPGAPGLEHLPVEVVADIVRRLDAWQVLTVLPRVCVAWRGLLCAPSGALWRGLLLDLRFFDDLRAFLARGPPAWAPLLRQLAARAPLLQDLALLVPPERQLQFVQAALAALGDSPRLRRLCAELYGCPARELPALLIALPERLEVVSLHGLAARGDGRQLGALQRLRQLRVLHLHFSQADPPPDDTDNWDDSSSADGGLAGGFPPALLACTALEELSIAGAGRDAFGDLPDGLARLQRLTRLALLGCGVASLPHGLTALTALEALHVTEARPTERPLSLPPSLAGLARLRAVELECAAVPAQLAGLPGLRHLALRAHARGMRRRPCDEVPGLEAVLQAAALESLGLHFWGLWALPLCVEQHASLRSLSLRGNLLRELPEGPYLQHLEHADVSLNRFCSDQPLELGAPALRTLALVDDQPLLVLRGANGARLPRKTLAASSADVSEALHRVQWACRPLDSDNLPWAPGGPRAASADARELLRAHCSFCEAADAGRGAGRQQADAFLPDAFLPALHTPPPTGPVRRWAERRLARVE